jgi:hypothetical protein
MLRHSFGEILPYQSSEFLLFFVNIEGLTDVAILMGLRGGWDLPPPPVKKKKNAISIGAKLFISV